MDFISYIRIELQDKVRRLGSNPLDGDQQVVEQQRQTMASMLLRLKRLQLTAGVIECRPITEIPHHNETVFDDLGDSTASSDSSSKPNLMTVEREVLHLPSHGNVPVEYSDLELRYRLQQANIQVNRLRDIIADISFQYSQIVRDPVRKSVQTRGRKQIKSLNHNLTLHANIYSRCRRSLIALKCNDAILRKFRELTKHDLKTSTAILKPNEPGSSSLRLSWIWQSGRWYLYGNPATGHNPNQNPGVVPNDNADASNDNADASNLLECL
jgi:hypothetical protein